MDHRVEWFCRQYGVDAGAERVLRQLHPEAQRRVLDEGPVGGGGANPSLELMNRIHRIETWEHGHHIAAFLSRAFVDTVAEDAFRTLPMEAQRVVMGYGPLMSAEPSAELMGRIREATGQRRDVPDRGDVVGHFASENAIDASAEAALRALPHDLQQKVLQEGPVRGTKNPSAVLMSRIRRVRKGDSGLPALGDAPRRSSSRDRGRGSPRRGRSRGRRSRSQSRSSRSRGR